MRRLPICVAMLVFVAVALPGAACAAPEVAFEARFVPIPGYQTIGGDISLGGPAVLHAAYKITGTEYGGSPPPLIALTLHVPPGTRIHGLGFKTCPTQVLLKRRRPESCPRASEAGPLGRMKGIVTFRGERVPEETTLQSFFTPNYGIGLLAVGHSPIPLKIPWIAQFGDFSGGEGFGANLVGHTLDRTSPGASDLSIEEIEFNIGAARHIRRRLKPRRLASVYYLRLGTRCPRGGFPFKSELTFASIGDLPQQTVTAVAFAPCPRRRQNPKDPQNADLA
jgi:hypothetical protein